MTCDAVGVGAFNVRARFTMYAFPLPHKRPHQLRPRVWTLWEKLELVLDGQALTISSPEFSVLFSPTTAKPRTP